MPGLERAIDLQADAKLLADAAQDAGAIALAHFQSDPQVWDKGGGAGPVTEADLAVNAMLESRLRAARPGYGWLSEETQDSDRRLSQDTTFIVDPIDGTRAFIEGSHHWGISLAVVQNGQPIAAVVAMPAKGDVYVAALGDGALKNGQPIQVSDHDGLGGARVLSTKWNFRPEFWRDGTPDVA
ncbi:MAG: inositol monophosphatase family protein, partial [Pseudomonadota bacterium]